LFYNCNKFLKKLIYKEEHVYKKYLKWISTALVLTGILLTNLNIYPINIYFHGLGVIGWTIAGFISKDKAILTNFGLQIPLFLIGIYKIIF
jgi:hypothetical protein